MEMKENKSTKFIKPIISGILEAIFIMTICIIAANYFELRIVNKEVIDLINDMNENVEHCEWKGVDGKMTCLLYITIEKDPLSCQLIPINNTYSEIKCPSYNPKEDKVYIVSPIQKDREDININ